MHILLNALCKFDVNTSSVIVGTDNEMIYLYLNPMSYFNSLMDDKNFVGGGGGSL